MFKTNRLTLCLDGCCILFCVVSYCIVLMNKIFGWIVSFSLLHNITLQQFSKPTRKVGYEVESLLKGRVDDKIQLLNKE